MTPQKSKKSPKKSPKIPGEVLVLFVSLKVQILVCYFCEVVDIVTYAGSIDSMSNSSSLTLGSHEVLIFGKFLIFGKAAPELLFS